MDSTFLTNEAQLQKINIDNQSTLVKNTSFPKKLYCILSDPKNETAITWLPDGCSWKVSNQKELETKVLPYYFSHSNFGSFMKDVNAFGFQRQNIKWCDNIYYHKNFIRSQPDKLLLMHRLPRMTNSSSVRPKDTCGREKVFLQATNNMSTQYKTDLIPLEVKHLDSNILSSQVPQGLFFNVHGERSSLIPLGAGSSANAKYYLEEKLRLNEIQIMHLQERINRRNCLKLATTNTRRNELVYCPNDSWKLANIDQQSVLQRCQFPCIISKRVLWKFIQDIERKHNWFPFSLQM